MSDPTFTIYHATHFAKDTGRGYNAMLRNPYRAACGSRVLSAKSNPKSVTCGKCKRTKAYKDALAAKDR